MAGPDVEALRLQPGRVYSVPDCDKPEQGKSVSKTNRHMTVLLSPPVRSRGRIRGTRPGDRCILTVSLTTQVQGGGAEWAVRIPEGSNEFIRRLGYADPATTRPMTTRQLMQGIQSRRYPERGRLGKATMQEIWKKVFLYPGRHAECGLDLIENYAALRDADRRDEQERARIAEQATAPERPAPARPERRAATSIAD